MTVNLVPINQSIITDQPINPVSFVEDPNNSIDANTLIQVKVEDTAQDVLQAPARFAIEASRSVEVISPTSNSLPPAIADRMPSLRRLVSACGTCIDVVSNRFFGIGQYAVLAAASLAA